MTKNEEEMIETSTGDSNNGILSHELQNDYYIDGRKKKGMRISVEDWKLWKKESNRHLRMKNNIP